MAINITDGFNLNYAAPVDYRMVVANSTARLALTYKYDGLKVFQLDTRVSYIWNPSGSGNWNIESYDKISGTGSTNYIPKFTGTNSTTGSWEIGNSPISASGSNVGINTNNQRGSYTYLQIGGTSLTEDPYWFAGQSLPLTIHKGGTVIIGYNWYWTGSANAYFNSAVGSSQILFSDNSMSFKTRPGSGSFVYNMIIYPGYVIFSDDIPNGSTTKSPMIRSQGSTSYSSQTTPDFTWWNNDQTGIFRPSANTIAFTNNGTESVRITDTGNVLIKNLGSVASPSISFIDDSNTGIYSPSADNLAFVTGGVERFRVRAGGASDFEFKSLTGTRTLGLSVYDSGYTTLTLSPTASTTFDISGYSGLVINGSLSKSSGSFRISHPLESKKSTHDLVHSFIEGPQADNIYRGKVTLDNGLATINLDIESNMSEGTFILLNREVQCFTTNETGWTAVKGRVTDNILQINSETTCSDEISWMVIGERHDKHMYDTEWTDNNGKVIVEPLKKLKEEI